MPSGHTQLVGMSIWQYSASGEDGGGQPDEETAAAETRDAKSASRRSSIEERAARAQRLPRLVGRGLVSLVVAGRLRLCSSARATFPSSDAARAKKHPFLVTLHIASATSLKWVETAARNQTHGGVHFLVTLTPG